MKGLLTCMDIGHHDLQEGHQRSKCLPLEYMLIWSLAQYKCTVKTYRVYLVFVDTFGTVLHKSFIIKPKTIIIITHKPGGGPPTSWCQDTWSGNQEWWICFQLLIAYSHTWNLHLPG